jgi:arylformamidase
MNDIDWDDAYANGAYIDGADGFPPRWASKALAFRKALEAKGKCQLNVPYGAHEREKFDLFLPDAAPRGLVVFVHGGYWQAFDKSSFSHLAAGAIAREYAVAIPSYVLSPEVPISVITQQIATAINAAAGMVAGPIHLTGHSAGGHLVTRMLCSDVTWAGCFPARISSVVSISGVHDLRPLLQTKMNDSFKMDAAKAAAESPLLHVDHMPVPVTAWVGEDERPVFIQQSQWLARDWDNAQIVIEPGKHHFDVIDGLEDATSPLMTALLP